MVLDTFEFKFESIIDPLENEKYVFEALQLDCYAFIFLYDVTSAESFKNLLPHIKSIDFKKYPDLNILIVGNKLDDDGEKKVSMDDAKKKVFNIITDDGLKVNNVSFFEVSLKDRTNLDDLFNKIYKNIFVSGAEEGFKGVKESKNLSVSLPEIVTTIPEIRISLFGPTSVGKTAFSNRVMQGNFQETLTTVGATFNIKFLKIGNTIAKFYLWDTAGQERYLKALPKTLFQNADGILLLVDVCDDEVEEAVEYWTQQINENCQGKKTIYLVGNKIDIVKELGVKIECGVEVGKDVTLAQLRKKGFKGFYIAIGAQGARKLGVDGEDAEGVIPGVDFLKLVANKSKKKLKGNVVVIGGGNVAVDVARTAARFGGESVSMFSLEQRAEMPAAEDEVLDAEKENIKVNCGWGPKEILTKDGKVTGVVFKKCVSAFDKVTGKFSPTYDEDDTITVEADFVLPAIGQSIEWGNLLKNTKVELGRGQTAKADSWTYQTAEPDVFVGGDVYTGPSFAINAIAAGKEGAESLHRYVWEGHSLTLGRVRRNNFKYIDKDNLIIPSYDHAKRSMPATDKALDMTFSDNRLPLTEEQVKTEAARCLSCGAAQVNPDLCIGCGLCTTVCKFDAIQLSKVRELWGTTYEKLIPFVVSDAAKKAVKLAKKKLDD